MREIMRSLLSSNLLVTGIIMFIGSMIVFAGSTFLLNATNVGKRLGFLITGAAIFGWGVINSIFFILYAPRGPAPSSIDGLNAFEIRIIPITFLIGSGILFIMFLLRFQLYVFGFSEFGYTQQTLSEKFFVKTLKKCNHCQVITTSLWVCNCTPTNYISQKNIKILSFHLNFFTY